MNEIKIQMAKDLSIFKDHTANREVDPRHVSRLKKAITEKNLLHLNPILVDRQLKVIDGQHRLDAGRQLEIAVYYVIDDNVGKRDIAALNSNQKNWTPLDYINFWGVEKAPGFDVINSFLARYPFFPVTTALRMMGDNSNSGYKDGYVDVSNVENAEKVAQLVSWFERNYLFARQRSFIVAITKLFAKKEFDPEKLKEKVMQQPRTVVPCISSDQYLEMFEEIYNYKLSQNRLAFK